VAAPNNLASYAITIREHTRTVLDVLPRNAIFDWMDKVSIELTTMMLATLFDFPWAERRELTYWSDVASCDINAPDAPVHSEEARSAELLRMADVFKGLWKERANASPRLDLIPMLAHTVFRVALPLVWSKASARLAMASLPTLARSIPPVIRLSWSSMATSPAAILPSASSTGPLSVSDESTL
jgi:hypothetical protein